MSDKILSTTEKKTLKNMIEKWFEHKDWFSPGTMMTIHEHRHTLKKADVNYLIGAPTLIVIAIMLTAVVIKIASVSSMLVATLALIAGFLMVIPLMITAFKNVRHYEATRHDLDTIIKQNKPAAPLNTIAENELLDDAIRAILLQLQHLLHTDQYNRYTLPAMAALRLHLNLEDDSIVFPASSQVFAKEVVCFALLENLHVEDALNLVIEDYLSAIKYYHPSIYQEYRD